MYITSLEPIVTKRKQTLHVIIGLMCQINEFRSKAGSYYYQSGADTMHYITTAAERLYKELLGKLYLLNDVIDHADKFISKALLTSATNNQLGPIATIVKFSFH